MPAVTVFVTSPPTSMPGVILSRTCDTVYARAAWHMLTMSIVYTNAFTAKCRSRRKSKGRQQCLLIPDTVAQTVATLEPIA